MRGGLQRGEQAWISERQDPSFLLTCRLSPARAAVPLFFLPNRALLYSFSQSKPFFLFPWQVNDLEGFLVTRLPSHDSRRLLRAEPLTESSLFRFSAPPITVYRLVAVDFTSPFDDHRKLTSSCRRLRLPFRRLIQIYFCFHAAASDEIQSLRCVKNFRKNNLLCAMEEAKADIVGLWALRFLINQVSSSMQLFYMAFLKGQALQFNWLYEKEAFILHTDVTFSVDFEKIEAAVEDLSREILTIQARGDKGAAKSLLQKYAQMTQPLSSALLKLESFQKQGIDEVQQAKRAVKTSANRICRGK
ncbi:Nudix hydrolase 3 [Platanthera guangdongensis]|uniref:Nudix hydrolase 3 n=1 Tax=Platanthera guangdongensis TaxID=2320717 RepID=A0ABR2MS09_9ASPA